VLVIAFGFPKTFIFEALSRFRWHQSFLGLLFPVLSDTKLAQWNGVNPFSWGWSPLY